MRKLFFRRTGRYTKDGIALDMEVGKALKPIFKKYREKGYTYREISHVVMLEATTLESVSILKEAVGYSKRKRKGKLE